MSPDALDPLLDRLATAHVLVVGDVMLDRYVTGEVTRISPEAPIPVLRVRDESAMLGGAGNVAANLAALGVQLSFLSVVGEDSAGAELTRLAAEGLGEKAHLVRDPGRQTPEKTRFIAARQQLLRCDREQVADISPPAAAELLAAVDAAIADGVGALALSDYGKGVLTPSICRSIIDRARAAGLPVVVDPKGADWARYEGAALVCPNRAELAEGAGLPTRGDAAIVKAADHVIASCGIAGVAATRSEEGMTLCRAGHDPLHLPALAREVYDVSGAGDTVVAALTAGLAAGADAADAARLANIAAGIVVGKVGTAVARVGEIRAELSRQDLLAGGGKLAGRDRAAELVARWRRDGKKVGFTNGCFDLIHPGHVALLDAARARCDRLVVAINSDDSVRRLKGPRRPLQTETARAAVLGSFAAVDLVVVFGEDTPLELIRALKPDLLVKGADYSADQVVGGADVRAWGGEVWLAPLEAGHSTTAIARRMAD